MFVRHSFFHAHYLYFKKNLNATRPAEHPTQGENVKIGGIIGCKGKVEFCVLTI